MAQSHKTGLLTLLLNSPETESALVFTRTKYRADRVADQLQVRGFDVARLHGDLGQSQRDQELRRFKDGKVQILVATDIAARGLDIHDITHVINYDVPNTAEDYVHRIGRTGRAQAVGDAFSLVAFEEEASMGDIERSLGKRLPRVIRPDFDYGAYVPQPPKAESKPPSATGMRSMRRPTSRRRRL